MKITTFDVPAPVVTTVILAVPADAIKLAEIEAFNRFALIYVVGTKAPFHSTLEALTNPEPLTVSVNAVVLRL